MYVSLIVANPAPELGNVKIPKACIGIIMSVHNFNNFGKNHFKIVADRIMLNSWTNFRVVPNKQVYQYTIVSTYSDRIYYVSEDTYDELSWLEKSSFKKSDLCQVDAIGAFRHLLRRIK